MKRDDFLKFVAAIAVSEAAGIIGSVFTISAIPTHSMGSGQAWCAGPAKPAFLTGTLQFTLQLHLAT